MKKLLCVALAAVMLAVACLSVGAAGLDELLKGYAGITYDGQSEEQLARFELAQAEIDWILREYWGEYYESIQYVPQYVTCAIYLDSHGIEWKTDGVIDAEAMARIHDWSIGKQAEVDHWYISEYLGQPLYDDDIILVAYEKYHPELTPEAFPYLDVECAELLMSGQHPIVKIKLNPKEGRDIFEEIDKLLAESEYPIEAAEPNYHHLIYLAGGSDDPGEGFVFDDVKEDRYYSRAVAVLSKIGIIKGVSKNIFAPNQATTRAMMTEILYRIDTMFGKVSVDASKPEGYEPFTDVEGKWYSGSADWARLTGVVKGYPDGSFRGDRPITRAEAATILYRYLKYAGLETEVISTDAVKRFSDADSIPSWAVDAVNYLYGTSVMTGMSYDKFDPNGQMTRAMIATVAYRVVEQLQSR
ncbi:MAG: S-layer homology domain-containing protein [Clostridia bacterium]|nr:S-layer homology domain-containing protein [Clostridia bacterium]